VYRGELGEVVYDFAWSRNRDGPLKMLVGYRGYLQVDAAPAYDDVFAQSPGIIEVGCIAHARRYFKEALPTAAVPCAQALAIIGQLYGIERAASDRQLDATARQRVRQEQARPILEKLQAYLQEQQAAALPKSPLGAAIGYALRNWVALTRYAEDGRLKIDNNGAEQALRPIVLGRKNWLFAGSEAAAPRTAILCSLVQTCKHLQINPFVYLRDVIERVSLEGTTRSLSKSGWARRGLTLVVRRRLDVGVSVVGSNGHRRCSFDRSAQACAGGIERVINAGPFLDWQRLPRSFGFAALVG
jgi:transposase